MVYTIFHINDLENQLFHKSWLEPSIEYTFTLTFHGCSRIQPVNQTFSEATIVNLTKKVGLIKFGQMSPFPPSEPGLFLLTMLYLVISYISSVISNI